MHVLIIIAIITVWNCSRVYFIYVVRIVISTVEQAMAWPVRIIHALLVAVDDVDVVIIVQERFSRTARVQSHLV